LRREQVFPHNRPNAKEAFPAILRDSRQQQAIQMASLPIIFVDRLGELTNSRWDGAKYEVINKDHKTEALGGFKQFADCRNREVSRAKHTRNGEYRQELDRRITRSEAS
jgi:hypothetical protein